MESVLGSLIPVLIALAILWRVVSGVLKATRGRSGGGPAARAGASEPFEEIQRRVERRRRELEEARQQMEWEAVSGTLEEAGPPEPHWEAAPPEGQPEGHEERSRAPARDWAVQPGGSRRSASPAAALVNRRTLRQAVLAHEILGPPPGLRPPGEGRGQGPP